MKIKRNIMSSEIEIVLTDAERRQAYEEQKFEYDKVDFIAYLREEGYENIDECPEDVINEMVHEYQRNMESLDATIGTNCKLAGANILHEYEQTLEKYKEKWRFYEKRVEVTVAKTYVVRAKNEEDAEAAFENWSERNSSAMASDLGEMIEYNGSWDDEDAVECEDSFECEYPDIDAERELGGD